jgi:hypothetical protein
MKYLVNKETKEHVIYVPWLMNSQWTLVEADSEGWIKHEGKECPLPDDCLCEVWVKGAKRPFALENPQKLYWSELFSYRPILTEQAEPVKASDHGEHDTMQDAMRAISPEYDKACDDFESELSDFIMGSNELKAPDYDPRSVSFNLLDRLKAAHEHAQQIPDLEAELREVLASMGYDLVARSPFTQQRHGAGVTPATRSPV